jgi:two-component system sensor histidine kinase QseC
MRSLRAQLTIRLLLGGALLLGAVGWVAFWQMRRALVAEFDASLRATAQSLATLTEEKGGRISIEFAEENMPQFDHGKGTDVFLLSAPDGREVERSPSLGAEPLPLRVGKLERPEYFDLTLADGRSLRCIGLRFVPQVEEEPAERRGSRAEAALVVGRDRVPLEHTLFALQTSLTLAGAGGLVALAGLVWWSVRAGLAPLDQLGERVAAVDAASLATRFPVEPLPAELQPIAGRLNELLARLESAFARERRFTATAAHELRTPLAELRALAEVNLTTPATDAERHEAWQDALATTLRMESLALSLLELARAEDLSRAIRREPVPLAEAFTAAWKPWAGRAAERGIALEATLAREITAATDPVLLGIVLGNLCANAVEHAPAGAPLRVRAASTPDTVTVLFQNRAGNLSPADLPHLFERFWRKDAARSNGRHHGLGLSLASEFAALLGGSLTADLSATGDLEFALRLPVPPAEAREMHPDGDDCQRQPSGSSSRAFQQS